MDFEQKLISLMKEKDLTDSSINLYIKNLRRLNNDEKLKNLNFLKKVDDILSKLENYKETTKRIYLISIVSALRTDEKMKKLYQKYRELMENKNKEIREQSDKNEMTETQKENWITWEEVKNKIQTLQNSVSNYKRNPALFYENQWNQLLKLVVLSLYYFVPPRRNDYLHMNVIYDSRLANDDNKNYLILDIVDPKNTPKFVFNKFKTAKKEGKVEQEIPDELLDIINNYLHYHPILKRMKINKKTARTINVPFLVEYDGTPVGKNLNGITRILNKIFHPKKVSSSMLRHIYLSSKYGDVLNEMKNDSKNMSHSIGTQKEYIKNNDIEV